MKNASYSWTVVLIFACELSERFVIAICIALTSSLLLTRRKFGGLLNYRAEKSKSIAGRTNGRMDGLVSPLLAVTVTVLAFLPTPTSNFILTMIRYYEKYAYTRILISTCTCKRVHIYRDGFVTAPLRRRRILGCFRTRFTIIIRRHIQVHVYLTFARRSSSYVG